MTNNEKTVAYFKKTMLNKEYITAEIQKLLEKNCGIKIGSILPSDLCFNSMNNGLDEDNHPKIFLKVKHGVYRYVGEDFNANSVSPYEFGTSNRPD